MSSIKHSIAQYKIGLHHFFPHILISLISTLVPIQDKDGRSSPILVQILSAIYGEDKKSHVNRILGFIHPGHGSSSRSNVESTGLFKKQENLASHLRGFFNSSFQAPLLTVPMSPMRCSSIQIVIASRNVFQFLLTFQLILHQISNNVKLYFVLDG